VAQNPPALQRYRLAAGRINNGYLLIFHVPVVQNNDCYFKTIVYDSIEFSMIRHVKGL
jgi:hypothetical protein